jgi:type 1 glutamine amidotransferase
MVPGLSFRPTRRLALLAVTLLTAAIAAGSAPAANPRVLVFTKTAGYRHASIPAAVQAVRTLGAQNGFDVDTTEDAAAFTSANLARYDAVVFLLTTGDVLDEGQQAAFEGYIRAGGGFVGVHSAADTERGWPWYGRLVGTWGSGHPDIQPAMIDVASPRDASTAQLPARWARTDEWYNLQENPRRSVRVLLTLDETTYMPGPGAMGADHPIAWSHQFDGGRAWYTAGGHTEESYSEPLFLGHLLGGIRYAMEKPAPVAPATAPAISSLKVSVRGRRVSVALSHANCTRCSGTLRVGSSVTKLRLASTAAKGTSPRLAAGRWRLSVVLRDATTGLSATARRWVRVR